MRRRAKRHAPSPKRDGDLRSGLLRAAEEILSEERELKEFCRSSRFSLEALDEKLQQPPGDGIEMRLDDDH